MKAVLVHRRKSVPADGSIVEMVIRRLPRPVPGSDHADKYRLFSGREGRRIVGFDDERGKGDHRRLDGWENPHRFRSPETSMQDFLSEVAKRWKGRDAPSSGSIGTAI